MIGVVVPAHGFSPFLAETLDCVLGQDPPPSRVVVVDDASPEPLALVDEHAARCVLVRREASGGPAGARASGLAVLGPDVTLVALCDSDDAWAPGKLAAQVAALERYPAAATCFGRALIVGTDGRATGERWDELAPGFHDGLAWHAQLYESNPITTSSVLIRRSALDAAGGFATSVPPPAEDWDLWLRLAARGEGFVFEPSAVVRYRRHPGGLTADVGVLARAQLALHREHGGLVPAAARERALAADEAALASVSRSGLRRFVPRRDPYRR